MTTKRQQQAFNECHVYRHWWKPTDVETVGDYYIQHMECQRCPMKRRWKVHRFTGDPSGNSYTPPEGYYHQREDDEDAAQVRKELRLFEIERNRKRKGRSQ